MPEKDKPRDLWDKLQLTAPLFSSFLIGILGIYFTNSYNNRQQEQTKSQQAAQIKLDSMRLQTQTVEAQAKIQAAQLEAMTKLAPYLSSNDKLKRAVGYAILNSVDSVSHVLKNTMQISFSTSGTIKNKDTGKEIKPITDMSAYGVALAMIKENTKLAINPALPFQSRIGAYVKIANLASDKTKEPIVQLAAAKAVKEIRKSANSPLLGIGFELADFQKYVDTLTLNSWRPELIVLHHTYSPNLQTLPDGFNESRILGFVKYFTETQRWRGAPHLFVDDHKIWVLNPLVRSGIHSRAWNKTSIGISLLGNYSSERADSGRGKAVIDNAIAAIAILEKKFKISPDSLKLHAEEKGSNKMCPGVKVDKTVIIQQTRLAKL